MNGFFGHIRDAEKFFAENPDIPVHFVIYEETAKVTILILNEVMCVSFCGGNANKVCVAMRLKDLFFSLK